MRHNLYIFCSKRIEKILVKNRFRRMMIDDFISVASNFLKNQKKNFILLKTKHRRHILPKSVVNLGTILPIALPLLFQQSSANQSFLWHKTLYTIFRYEVFAV